MSHHYSGPQLGFPNGNAQLDFCDLYAFPKPGDEGKSILIMNVHPSSSLMPSEEATTSIPFAADALYEIKIDTNGDNVADLTYQVAFSPFTAHGQTATLRLITSQIGEGAEGNAEVLIESAAVSLDATATVTEGGDHLFFAGWRSDPFFFDPPGAFNEFQFTTDWFADKDVCSIAVEIPNSAFGKRRVGLWARTLTGVNDRRVQVDRGALAAQSVFLTGDDREAYVAADPVDDANFVAVFGHSLEHTGGYSREDAQRVARTLLPDILPFDPTQSAAYPHNGRTLIDDAMGVFLPILTNNKVTSHGLSPHHDLLTEFPYVGPPHIAFADRPTP
ncbi:DUF4331 family protein [Mycobacterium sp. MMS18-G62]